MRDQGIPADTNARARGVAETVRTEDNRLGLPVCAAPARGEHLLRYSRLSCSKGTDCQPPGQHNETGPHLKHGSGAASAQLVVPSRRDCGFGLLGARASLCQVGDVPGHPKIAMVNICPQTKNERAGTHWL